MPRGSGSRSSSPSRSNTSTARSSATAVQPPKTQQNQMATRGGLGSMLLSGMAFGAGAEFMRQLFRNPTTGGYMMPLFISGLAAFGSNKFFFANHPKKGILTAAVFAGTFVFTKSTLFAEQNHE